MTAYRYWTIGCDAEGCFEEADGTEVTATATRVHAREQGWTVGPGGKDYCPEHSVPQDRLTEVGAGGESNPRRLRHRASTRPRISLTAE